MHITDNSGAAVLTLDRPFRAMSPWCLCFPINFCFLQRMTVTSPITNQVLGTIEQRWSLWYALV